MVGTFGHRCRENRKRLVQVRLQEGEDLAPAVHCLLLAVVRRMVVEETVAGAVVPVEIIVLAGRFQLFFVLVHLFRRRRLVIVAE